MTIARALGTRESRPFFDLLVQVLHFLIAALFPLVLEDVVQDGVVPEDVQDGLLVWR